MTRAWHRRRWIRVAGPAVAGGIALVLASCSLFVWMFPHGGLNPPPAREIRIEPGMSLADVADLLAREELIGNPAVFRWGARLEGKDRQIKAGRYSLSSGLSPHGLLARLVAGATIWQRLTLPEGLTAEEFAGIVADSLDVSAAVFLAAADSLVREHLEREAWLGDAAGFGRYAELMQGHGPAQPRDLHWCEGYLAPNTYHFAEGTRAERIARQVVGTGLRQVEDVDRRKGPGIGEFGLTPHELVTLASIVEAEARLREEQRTIAAVYFNRLRLGWRLEADPCVAYLLDKRGKRILYRDLEHPSPYNTYRHGGLPPGPIGNPGGDALRAVARPDPESRALFFVADGRGGHVFSETRQEHEAAVARYRDQRSRGSGN